MQLIEHRHQQGPTDLVHWSCIMLFRNTRTPTRKYPKTFGPLFFH